MLERKQIMIRSALNVVGVLLVFVLMYWLQAAGIMGSHQSTVVVTIGINVIMAVSLNMVTGVLGQLTLGHAGFMSVGAYAAALLTKALPWPIMVSLPVGLLFGGIIAAIFGMIIGIPALRLRGDYLAIITLAFGEIIRIAINNLSFTGGAKGLRGIPMLNPMPKFTIIYICATMTIFVVVLVIRSRQGRAIISIREDQIASEACGIDSTRYKLMAFMIGAFFAGVAGGLYAHHLGVLEAKNFGFNKSVEIVVMVVMGGMGSTTGSVIAATLLSILPEGLRSLKSIPGLAQAIPFLADEARDPRMVIYSLLLVLIMIFLPKGLAGLWNRKELSVYGMVQWIKKKVMDKPNDTNEKGA